MVVGKSANIFDARPLGKMPSLTFEIKVVGDAYLKRQVYILINSFFLFGFERGLGVDW